MMTHEEFFAHFTEFCKTNQDTSAAFSIIHGEGDRNITNSGYSLRSGSHAYITIVTIIQILTQAAERAEDKEILRHLKLAMGFCLSLFDAEETGSPETSVHRLNKDH
jgi:hypothetical protein